MRADEAVESGFDVKPAVRTEARLDAFGTWSFRVRRSLEGSGAAGWITRARGLTKSRLETSAFVTVLVNFRYDGL